ncbi:MAG: S8 family serine peptidase [Fimbriimonadaceae bacterium]|nr:S8 family serine peptidase [Fimbriimonadaceae bacterium]
MIGIAIALATLGTQAAPTPILAEGVRCHPERLLVRVASPFAENGLQLAGVRVTRRMPEIGWVVVSVPRRSLQATRARLNRWPGLRAEYDRAAEPAYAPNDPLWPQMWHYPAIGVDAAWDLSFGSAVPVAVIDTGVMAEHEDLAANMWTNAGEIAGNGIDDDHNGYIDDVHGWDFAYSDADITDVFGHGTACAGIVAAVQDNGLGGTGVAPRAKIMALKTATNDGYFYDSATVPAYLYAAAMGARVLSMSYFSDRVSLAERDAMNYCTEHGVLPVAAAGNANSVIPFYPGAYPNVVAVAALDTNLLRAGFSNWGSWVDVAAPGVSLVTTTNDGSYTFGFAGTSGATPHVAGVAALLFGARPAATAAEVRDAIEDTAVPIVQAPFGEFSNYGRVDAFAALTALLGTAAPPRPGVVRWMSPTAVSIAYAASEEAIVHRGRIQGRGFQAPGNVSVWWGPFPVRILARDRDWIDVDLPLAPGVLQVKVDGVTVGTVRMPAYELGADEVHEPVMIYGLAEASTQGATLTGGFTETANQDGQEMRCTRREDGTILVQGTFQNVHLLTDRAYLKILRRYTPTSAGTERLYLYDWTSGSYPYGNWVQIGSRPLSAGGFATYTVSNPSRFVDPEHTVYFLLQTTNDVVEGTELRIDMLQFRNAIPR